MIVYFNDYVASIRRNVGVKHIQIPQENCNVVFMSWIKVNFGTFTVLAFVFCIGVCDDFFDQKTYQILLCTESISERFLDTYQRQVFSTPE